jgi:hypothetical protein
MDGEIVVSSSKPHPDTKSASFSTLAPLIFLVEAGES